MFVKPASHAWEREIEGLRAVAVLAVVLHHAFPAWLPGGFCGVDIFFVISGYLIGRQLMERARAGQLSFAAFYAARARRLFPALVTVLAATWGFAALVMTGPELAALGRHMAASAGFANNLLLASEGGYFDAPAATKPLLHLWSLGVEEQFYLLAPILVWLATKRQASAWTWVARLGAASLLWMSWAWSLKDPSDFYLPTVRFWELAAGVALAAWRVEGRNAWPASSPREATAWASALLGLTALQSGMVDWDGGRLAIFIAAGSLLSAGLGMLMLARPWDRVGATHERRRQLACAALPWVGLVLIAASVLGMPIDAWPGPQTLVPVLGAILVLACGGRGRVSGLLGSAPAVWIGAISYPLYLWHWPMLVLAKLVVPSLGAGATWLVLGLSLGLAWATKALVEDPIRFGRFFGKKVWKPPIAVPAAGLMAVALAGVVSYQTGGLPQRYPASMHELAAWSDPLAYRKWRIYVCYHIANINEEYAPECSPAPRQDHPTVLLWGDSHAAHLYPGLARFAAQERWQFAQWTKGSCPPTLRAVRAEVPWCNASRESTWEKLRTYVPDTVVLSAVWGAYLRAGNSAEELAANIQATVQELHRRGVRRVVVFGPGPLWDQALPAALHRHMALHGSGGVPDRFGRVPDDLADLDRRLRAASRAANAGYVSVLHALCDPRGCRTLGDSDAGRLDLLFIDREHLSESGARIVAEAGWPVISGAVPESAGDDDSAPRLRD